jgi:hypothetical protein
MRKATLVFCSVFVLERLQQCVHEWGSADAVGGLQHQPLVSHRVAMVVEEGESAHLARVVLIVVAVLLMVHRRCFAFRLGVVAALLLALVVARGGSS